MPVANSQSCNWRGPLSAAACQGTGLRPLVRAVDPPAVPAFGYWMTCSDEHFGEYLAYGWEGSEKGYDFAADQRGRAEFANTLEHVLAGAPLPPRLAHAVGRARCCGDRRYHPQ